MPHALLDVSPITARPEGRTGLARVSLSLILALAARRDVAISSCACGSLIATDDFDAVRKEFPSINGLSPRRSSWEVFCTNQLRRSSSHGGPARAAWRLIGQVTNRLRNPLAGIELRRFDLVHSTYARLPRVVRRQNLPAAITVHDVMPLRLPAASLPPGQVAITKRILGSIRHSDWVACVSEWTRSDFLDVTGHSPDRTVVIPNGVDHRVFYPDDSGCDDGVRCRLGLAERSYFLTLSSLAPHKNMQLLLDAWSRSGAGDRGSALVMAGGRTTDTDVVMKAIGVDATPPGVILTGYLSDIDFRALASRCQAFLFPSLYEGFGLPVLEAMACGAPVIASNRTSIPEVVADAGELLDPTDVEAWTEAIRSAALAPHRTSADAASIGQAAKFSWDGAAAGYLALYRRMLS